MAHGGQPGLQAPRLRKEKKQQERRDLTPASQLQPRARGLRYENIRSARAEEGLLRLLLLDPGLLSAGWGDLTGEEFSSPLLGRAFDLLRPSGAGGPVHPAGRPGGELTGEEMDHLAQVAAQPEYTANGRQSIAGLHIGHPERGARGREAGTGTTCCWPHKRDYQEKKAYMEENTMSIEKDRNARYTITEEQKDKADSRQISRARMEAGKVEIMKVVEGVPGAEKLTELIERGKKKGSLSASELLDVLEDMDLGAEQMDKIYDTLENLGIDTVGEDYIPELPDDAEPPLEAMEEITEEEMVDPNAMVDSFGTDDPVRMYLKEIGKVNLLTSDEEIELAQDMAAGNAAKEQLEELEKAGEEIPAEVQRGAGQGRSSGGRRPSSGWPRPTCVWWCPSPSGMWAGGCSSWT